jgi:ABC-type multidrug transport system permease subunit
MKAFDIALKDLRQYFRSYFAVAFMFIIPVLVTALFYIMFRGLRNEGDEFSIPTTKVVFVNLDQGSPTFSAGLPAMMSEQLTELGVGAGEISSMGDLMVKMLQSKSFADLLTLSTASDAASARSAVDNQEAGVAIIIPENFTAVLVEPGGSADIELYKDPSLTIGPGIVQSILSQFADYAASAKIGMSVVMAGLNEAGLTIDAAQTQELVIQFVNPSPNSSSGESAGGGMSLIEVKPPVGKEQASSNLFMNIIRNVFSGMLVFYAFFTGASTAESILTEEEKGTLPRLFTTPTLRSSIVSGKFISTVLTVSVQGIVLIVFGHLVFGINWGEPLPVILAVLGMVITTSSLGIFIVSFLTNSRQAGIVYGGVLTVTGMLGMIKVFTMGSPNAPPALGTVTLFVPQGWTMRGFQLAMDAASSLEVLPVFGVLLIWSAFFFTIGTIRLSRRFAN